MEFVASRIAGLVLFFTLRHRLESLINAMLARWP